MHVDQDKSDVSRIPIGLHPFYSLAIDLCGSWYLQCLKYLSSPASLTQASVQAQVSNDKVLFNGSKAKTPHGK